MWLIISIISYFLNAVVATIDKFLIAKKIPEPIVYTFYIGFLSIFSLSLIFIGGLVLPNLSQLLVSFIAGILFMTALFLFFKSLKLNEPSRVIPLIGAFMATFSVILSFFILQETFSRLITYALLFLLLGGLAIAIVRYQKKEQLIRGWPYIILCAFLFALSLVFSKFIYLELPFVSGFIWIRIGGFIFTFGLLIIKKTRQVILNSLRATDQKTPLLLLGNQGVSAIAFILLNLAISLGSVSLVNALQGVQYVFILLLALLISKRYPFLFTEELSKRAIVQKVLAILLIVIGLFILIISKY